MLAPLSRVSKPTTLSIALLLVVVSASSVLPIPVTLELTGIVEGSALQFPLFCRTSVPPR